MHAEFGPWTTAFSNRSGLQLSSFWKTRMALLETLVRVEPGCPRRAAVILAVAAVAMALVPLIDLQQAMLAPVHAGEFPGGTLVPGPKSTPVSEKAWRTLAKPTTVDFIDLPLADALRFVQEYHNVALRRDDAAITAAGISLDRPVTMRLTGTSLRSVLGFLLDPADLDLFVDETGLVITTRDEAAAHLSELMYPLGSVSRAGIPLAELGDAITQCVDPPSWQKKGGRGSLRSEKGALSIRQAVKVHEQVEDLFRELYEALRDPRAMAGDARLETHEYPIGFLQNLGAADSDLLEWINESLVAGSSPVGGASELAEIQDDRLILTQPAWIQTTADPYFKFLAMLKNSSPGFQPVREHFLLAASTLNFDVKRRVARKRLGQPVSANFVDLPLEDALTFLKEFSQSKILDSDEVRGVAKLRNAPVTIKAQKEPLSNLLDKVLQPLKLDWYLFDADIIVITSRATAAGRLEPRVYRTTEILAAGRTEKGLAARISAIEFDSWAAAGGPGQMRFLPGVLIVAQNRRVHEQIASLFSGLEKGPEKRPK
jgi:hypothetical protein